MHWWHEFLRQSTGRTLVTIIWLCHISLIELLWSDHNFLPLISRKRSLLVRCVQQNLLCLRKIFPSFRLEYSIKFLILLQQPLIIMSANIATVGSSCHCCRCHYFRSSLSSDFLTMDLCFLSAFIIGVNAGCLVCIKIDLRVHKRHSLLRLCHHILISLIVRLSCFTAWYSSSSLHWSNSSWRWQILPSIELI